MFLLGAGRSAKAELGLVSVVLVGTGLPPSAVVKSGVSSNERRIEGGMRRLLTPRLLVAMSSSMGILSDAAADNDDDESNEGAFINAKGMDLVLFDRLKQPGLGVPRAARESRKDLKEETGDAWLAILGDLPRKELAESGVTAMALVGVWGGGDTIPWDCCCC